MKFTYYGHSCFEIQIQNKKVLFDPFITPNALAKNIDITSLKPDFILVTHGHGDHVADLVQIGKQSGALVVSNFEIVEWLRKQGFIFQNSKTCRQVNSSCGFPNPSFLICYTNYSSHNPNLCGFFID